MADSIQMPEPTVTVSAAPLRQILAALIGPPHMLRELEVIAGLPEELSESRNPVAQLVEEFNEQMNK